MTKIAPRWLRVVRGGERETSKEAQHEETRSRGRAFCVLDHCRRHLRRRWDEGPREVREVGHAGQKGQERLDQERPEELIGFRRSFESGPTEKAAHPGRPFCYVDLPPVKRALAKPTLLVVLVLACR